MNIAFVFDTNIFLSALLSLNGKPHQCLELAKEGIIQSITCEEILDEIKQKLISKFQYSSENAQSVINEILSYSHTITIQNTLQVIKTAPKDNMILECAIVGNTTHIITGDQRHLLP